MRSLIWNHTAYLMTRPPSLAHYLNYLIRKAFQKELLEDKMEQPVV